MMLIYALTFVVLMVRGRTPLALLSDTVDTELEILKIRSCFARIYYFLSWDCFVSCVTPFRGQGMNLAMLSGVSEMIARTLVSICRTGIRLYLQFVSAIDSPAGSRSLIQPLFAHRKLKELRCPLTEG